MDDKYISAAREIDEILGDSEIIKKHFPAIEAGVPNGEKDL